MTSGKNKNVAIFVNSEFIPSYSGASNRFHYLSRALELYTDTNVIVLHCDRGWSDLKLIKSEKFKTYVINHEAYKDISLLSEILVKENINLIQFADLEFAIELGIPLSYTLNIPIVFEAHFDAFEFARTLGTPKKELSQVQFLENTFGKYFDRMIALSNEDRFLAKNYRVSKKNISIIPNGVNIDEFPKNCFSANSKKIIFLGNLFFGVNLKSVKEIKKYIYRKLRLVKYTFNIIGDISDTNKKLLQDENFNFLGKQKDLSKSFNKSLVALAPVLSGAGIRIKIPTYMNAGVPVITTHEGARGFARKDLLIIEDDLKKYPGIIAHLRADKVRLTNLSENGRLFVRDNLSWQVIANQVSQVYDTVLQKKQTDKSKAIKIINTLIFDDPAWIKEIIRKKRFKNVPNTPKGKYVIIN